MKFEYTGQVMGVNSREAQGKLFNKKNFGKKITPSFKFRMNRLEKMIYKCWVPVFTCTPTGAITTSILEPGPSNI